MNKTPIEWCRTYAPDGSFTEGYSVNPIRFRPHGSSRLTTMCQKVSPGCANCYAEGITRRFWPTDSKRKVASSVTMGIDLIPVAFPGYTAEGVSGNAGEFELDERQLLSVLKTRKPGKVFWGDMTDLFGDWVKDEWLDRCFAVMALTPHLTHILLTKRPERMLAYMSCAMEHPGPTSHACRMVQAHWLRLKRMPEGLSWDVADMPGLVTGAIQWPLQNVWLGVSVENQKAADERIPQLLQTPAAVRFLSCEPLLGPVEIRWFGGQSPHPRRVKQLPDVERNGKILAGACDEYDGLRMLDLVIVGGESGPGARPMHPEWARGLRNQCQAAGVAFFFKQWGEWGPQVGDIRSYEYLPARTPCCFMASDGHIGYSAAEMAGHGMTGRMIRFGKKAAGRMLDGREWNQTPEVRS